ncbi:Uncharacterised protein [Helicobacter mustelae]|nr:Uncharacterised protein [Helicobacter mustelae]
MKKPGWQKPVIAKSTEAKNEQKGLVKILSDESRVSGKDKKNHQSQKRL